MSVRDSEGRALAIQRSPYSYFQPSWDLGLWDDFERPWGAFRQRMVEMERHMDDMYRNFWSADPFFERAFGGMPGAHGGPPPLAPRGAAPSAALPSPHPPTLHRSLSQSHTEPNTPSSSFGATKPTLSEITSSSLCPYGFGREFDDLCKINPSSPLEGSTNLPIVTAPDGSKNIKLTFDVRQFKPQEITVKTQDSRLLVTAKHDETTENSRVYREFHRMFTLPPGITPESLKSSLSAEGVLSIEAPLQPPPAVSQETLIPITHEKSNNAVSNN